MPKGWLRTKLPEVAWYQEGPGLRKWQFVDSGVKVLNITNIVDGKIRLDKTSRYISEAELNKKYKHFLIDAGDIVVASSGNSYCKHGVVRQCDLPLVMNTSVIRFKPLKGVCYNFLNQFLKSRLFKDQIDVLITGGAQPNFGPSHLERIDVLLPPMAEQEKIAKILSTWDEAIECISKLIESKDKCKANFALKILSGENRLNGYSQSWTKKKLKELGGCVRGLTYSPKNIADDGLLVLRSSNVLNGQIDLQDNVYVDLNVQDQFLSKPGDILICVRNGSRNLIGKTALIPDNLPRATHGAFMTIFRTKYSSYVFQLFQTEMYHGQVAKNLGATINSINNSDLLEFVFPFPSDEKEIRDISFILECFDREISILRYIRFSYQSQKQGLMQQLLTGKRRVKL